MPPYSLRTSLASSSVQRLIGALPGHAGKGNQLFLRNLQQAVGPRMGPG